MRLLTIIFLIITCRVSYAAELPFGLAHALQVIESTYGDKVRIKPKTLLKFGRSTQVDNSTYTTLMTLPAGTLNETYPTDNTITHVSSSSAGDTQQITVEGHKLVGTDLIFVSENVTLNGQNKVALTTPLFRATRGYNRGTTDFAGNIYVFEDDTLSSGVPATAAKVHLIIPSGSNNQSFKAATSISYKDYWLITAASGSILSKTGSPVVELQIQVREYGKVFRTVATAAAATAGSTFVHAEFDPPIIVPKNADFRMRALGSASGLDVSGWVNGYLALVQD